VGRFAALSERSMPDFLVHSNTAVKAVIYRSDGRLLMQQRDDIEGLPFAGCWTFFGGLAEPGETPEQALERELAEELGGVPGARGSELFTWEWKADWSSTRNHYFPVLSEVDASSLNFTEGQAAAWHALEDLPAMPLTPAVYENFARIARFLGERSPGLVERLEATLLRVNDLTKRNERVFYARRNPCVLPRQQIFLLKELASLRDLPVFRVCLHTRDDADIHEMMMVHTRPSSVGPLKQNKTSLSYHMVSGALTIRMHDESGAVSKEYLLGEGPASESRGVSIRLDAAQFRSVHSTSPFSIFVEVASGPFQDSDTVWLNARN
jgi:8-oxo-dGTP diphosphatase